MYAIEKEINISIYTFTHNLCTPQQYEYLGCVLMTLEGENSVTWTALKVFIFIMNAFITVYISLPEDKFNILSNAK